ncbi:hypothetical protein, partial [Alcanivorax sp.]|uniref:hypothetical protein n=1 Tax=Alcanivorax sp. TaxID=1872427 RepID=UPI0025BA4195
LAFEIIAEVALGFVFHDTFSPNEGVYFFRGIPATRRSTSCFETVEAAPKVWARPLLFQKKQPCSA